MPFISKQRLDALKFERNQWKEAAEEGSSREIRLDEVRLVPRQRTEADKRLLEDIWKLKDQLKEAEKQSERKDQNIARLVELVPGLERYLAVAWIGKERPLNWEKVERDWEALQAYKIIQRGKEIAKHVKDSV